MRSFDGKRALITGGSSGIGLALAKALAGQGAHVAIVARGVERLQESVLLIRAAGKRADQQVEAIAADVANEDSLRQALAPYLNAHGAPDLLINCAGITNPGLFEEMPLQLHRDNMEINFFGTLHACRVVVPGMIERRTGYIVNISSLVGMHGVYGYSAYAPSKFAVRGLSDALHYELKPYGIGVSVVFPSDTDTPQLAFDKAHQTPVMKALIGSNVVVSPPEKVAQNILRGIQRRKPVIMPSNDARLWFLLFGLLPGNTFYGLVDRMTDTARRKAAKDLKGQ